MNRRGFLAAILASGMAPAIVKAANIMPIFVSSSAGLVLPSPEPIFVASGGNTLLTIDRITREAALLVGIDDLRELGYDKPAFLKLVNMAVDEMFSGCSVGDTIQIRIPTPYTPRTL